MAKLPKKALIIGWDSAQPSRLEKHVKDGGLPTIKKMMEGGVFAENSLVPYPTVTPPNWTTIVTGAWAGTHGITDFHVHKPGDPLDKVHQGFTTDDCQAEDVGRHGQHDDRSVQDGVGAELVRRQDAGDEDGEAIVASVEEPHGENHDGAGPQEAVLECPPGGRPGESECA